LEGAINEEIDAYNGTTFHVTRRGLLQNECECEDCPHFAREQKAATPIKAVWCAPGQDASWTFETEIPHATFRVMEDNELFCIGIVFSLDLVG
jgi:hypothetical protein